MEDSIELHYESAPLTLQKCNTLTRPERWTISSHDMCVAAELIIFTEKRWM